MDGNSALIAAVATLIPSLVIGVIGWFMRTLIADLKASIRSARIEIGELRKAQSTQTALFDDIRSTIATMQLETARELHKHHSDVHARISKIDKDVAEQKATLKQHITDSEHGRRRV
jgi:hypothetical protein